MEGVNECIQEISGVVDDGGVFSNHPHHRGLGFGVFNQVHHRAHGDNDGSVLVGVESEDVSDYNHGFLDDVGNLALKEVEKDGDALIDC